MKTYLRSIHLDSESISQLLTRNKTQFLRAVSAAMRLVDFKDGNWHETFNERIIFDPEMATVDITEWFDPTVTFAGEKKSISTSFIEQFCPRLLEPQNATMRRNVRVLNVLASHFSRENLADFLET